MRSVKEVMDSRNMAVFGASRDPLKAGSVLLELLRKTRFLGRLAGINPGGGEVNGFTLYKHLDDVPFEVDLGVMLIPPHAVPDALRACARKGVKGVVISSEGFAEAGGEGGSYQEEAHKIFCASGMRGFGPNTLGVVNTSTGMTTSYIADARALRPGSVGMVAQSGIFVGALLRYISSVEGLQLSKGLGLGNKVDVDESDALAYLAQDDATRMVGLYLEDIRDGRRFLEVARECVQKKPVLLLKGGVTERGAQATATHTASLAMNDVILDGALRQAGVIRVGSVDELVSTLLGFSLTPLPRGDRIAVVTYSGAQAVMSIDEATKEGLLLADLGTRTREMLSQVIKNSAKASNPVDMFPDMMSQGFEKTNTQILRALLMDPGVHGVVFISFARSDIQSFLPLVEVVKEKGNKPVFFSLLGTREDVEGDRDFLEKHGIPFYSFPETAVRVFARMWRYARKAKES